MSSRKVCVKVSFLRYVACCAELLHMHFFVLLDEISQETKSVYRTKLLILFVAVPYHLSPNTVAIFSGNCVQLNKLSATGRSATGTSAIPNTSTTTRSQLELQLLNCHY